MLSLNAMGLSLSKLSTCHVDQQGVISDVHARHVSDAPFPYGGVGQPWIGLLDVHLLP